MARLTGALAAAAACLAVIVAAVGSLAGCAAGVGSAASSAAGGSSSLTNGHRADHVRDRLRRHLLAHPGAQRLERQPPRPAGHPAVPARRGQRPARPAGRQPAGHSRCLRRHRPGRGLDGRVRLGGLDHPAAGRQFPLRGLPARRPSPPPSYQGRLYAVPYYSNADLLYYRTDILARRTRSRPRPGRSWPGRCRPGRAPKYTWTATRPVRAVRGPDGQLRRGGPVGGRVDPVPRRHRRSPSTRRRPGRPGVPGQRAPPGLDPDGRPRLRGGVSASTRSRRASCCSSTTGRTSTRPPASPDPATRWSASSAWSRCPAWTGPGSSSLGGANLAISAYSQHQRTALAFIQYLTSLSNERAMLDQRRRSRRSGSSSTATPACSGSSRTCRSSSRRSTPPSRARSVADYDQVSLAISSAVHAALRPGEAPQQALSQLMARQLAQIIQ